MTLANYINDLLYRYDCVVIPDFGGFVTNVVSAKVNQFSHTFYPPTKQITFNSLLKNNDGLLANYIASSENVSFEKAVEIISSTVKTWQQQLQNESLLVGKIGSLSLNKEQQLVFEPNQTTNYLTASFGLSSFSSPTVKRLEYNKQGQQVAPIASTSKKAATIFKYAATVAVVLTLGTIGWNANNQQQQKESYAQQQKAVEQKIQSATFVISNPLPTIKLNVTKTAAKGFHIVAGAFQFPENAEKKLHQLKAKGFDAKVLGKNKWNLTQVAYTSFSTRAEAFKNLNTIRKEHSKDAWLLVKKFD
ncbi:MAG: SPOR domain-containing protein [Polaribacter sp.]|nr:SPOR domain-containing protein [Polaribacter sp.]